MLPHKGRSSLPDYAGLAPAEMKLVFCPDCEDIFKLSGEIKHCSCGKCYGWYEDRLNAVINECSIPIGIDNYSFLNALRGRPPSGDGAVFKAFVIPHKCPTIRIDR